MMWKFILIQILLESIGTMVYNLTKSENKIIVYRIFWDLFAALIFVL